MMERPEAGSYSATSRRTELEPTSMAAMRSRAAGAPLVAPGLVAVRTLTSSRRPGARLAAVLGVVLDGLALDQEDHVLADVGGEIGHPLEVAAHQEELHADADH